MYITLVSIVNLRIICFRHFVRSTHSIRDTIRRLKAWYSDSSLVRLLRQWFLFLFNTTLTDTTNFPPLWCTRRLTVFLQISLLL